MVELGPFFCVAGIAVAYLAYCRAMEESAIGGDDEAPDAAGPNFWPFM